MRRWCVLWLCVGCQPGEEPLELCDAMETWQDEPMPQEIVQAFRRELGDSDTRGVAWAILVDGEIRYAHALGVKDPETGAAMEPDTLMRTGSTLKMQTAAAVLALEGDGTLSRDDSVAMHLPEFSITRAPGVAEQATVHQLLTHQGGFFDYTPIDGPAGERALYRQAHEVFATDFPVLTEPGHFFNYANPNYSLAGLVAQEASGRPYAELMGEMWGRLCMDRTTFEADVVEADGNYARANTTLWEAPFDAVTVGPGSYDEGFARPAGFAWSSVMDMLRFGSFLLEGDESVMPKALVDELTSPQVDMLDPSAGRDYGYGIMVFDGFTVGTHRTGRLWTHGGAIPGYAADLYVHPDSGVAVAVLANFDGGYFNDAVATVLDVLADPPEGTAPDPEVDDDLSVFEGTYVDVDNVGALTIRMEDDGLVVEAPLLEQVSVPFGRELVSLGRGNFLWDVDGTTLVITFVEDDSGVRRWIRHRAFVAERSDTEPQAMRMTAGRASIERVLGVVATDITQSWRETR